MKPSPPRDLTWPTFNYARHLPALGTIKVPLIVYPDTAFDVFIDRTHRRFGEGIMYHIRRRKNSNN